MKNRHVQLMITFIVIVTAMTLCSHAQDIHQTIIQKVAEEKGYSENSLKIYNKIKNNSGNITFSIFAFEEPDTTNRLLVGEITPQGELLCLEGPRPQELRETLRQEIYPSQKDLYCLYEYQQKWKARVADANEQERKEFAAVAKFYPFEAFFTHPLMLPDEQTIPLETARQVALSTIQATKNWTAEHINYLLIDLEALHMLQNHPTPVYQFVYRRKSTTIDWDSVCANEPFVQHKELLYLSKENADTVRNQEDKIFPGKAPKIVSVRIDAITGAPVGDVYIAYPGDDFSGSPIQLLLD